MKHVVCDQNLIELDRVEPGVTIKWNGKFYIYPGEANTNLMDFHAKCSGDRALLNIETHQFDILHKTALVEVVELEFRECEK